MDTKVKITSLMIAALVIVVLGAFWVFERISAPVIPAAPVVESVAIGNGALIATGKNLTRVEWWAIPTGTGVTTTDYEKLGNAVRASTSADGTQIWQFTVPKDPVLATAIFARGYGAPGAQSVDVPLPEEGATALNNAIWAKSGDVTLGPGESGTVAGLTVTFNALVQDSRCPVDAQCIEAGAVNTNVTFAANGTSTTRNMPSDEVPQEFEGRRISIVSVAPDRRSNAEIAPGDYRITFHIDSGASGQ